MSEKQAKAERREAREQRAADCEQLLAVDNVLRAADALCAGLSHVLGAQTPHPAGIYREADGPKLLDATGQPVASKFELVAVQVDAKLAERLMLAMLTLRQQRGCEPGHNVLGERFVAPVVLAPGGRG